MFPNNVMDTVELVKLKIPPIEAPQQAASEPLINHVEHQHQQRSIPKLKELALADMYVLYFILFYFIRLFYFNLFNLFILFYFIILIFLSLC